MLLMSFERLCNFVFFCFFLIFSCFKFFITSVFLLFLLFIILWHYVQYVPIPLVCNIWLHYKVACLLHFKHVAPCVFLLPTGLKTPPNIVGLAVLVGSRYLAKNLKISIQLYLRTRRLSLYENQEPLVYLSTQGVGPEGSKNPIFSPPAGSAICLPFIFLQFFSSSLIFVVFQISTGIE